MDQLEGPGGEEGESTGGGKGVCKICVLVFFLNTVDPRVTTGLTYEQLGLRPECRSRPKRVSACEVVNKDPRCVCKRHSEPTRVCGRNFGQCSALYN
jgi:hypothetical protein